MVCGQWAILIKKEAVIKMGKEGMYMIAWLATVGPLVLLMLLLIVVVAAVVAFVVLRKKNRQ